MAIWCNVARKREVSSSGAVNILNAIILRKNYPIQQLIPSRKNKMLNSINLLVYSIILLPFLTILPVSVSLSNTALNVMADSHSDSDKIRAIDSRKSSSSLSWNDINDFVYQLQDINLTAIGGTKFDIVIMDYSKDGSDSDR